MRAKLADFMLACGSQSWDDGLMLYDTVVITGASSGFGEAFARHTVEMTYDHINVHMVP